MTARRIDGKAAAQAIRESIAKLVPAFVGKTGRPPGLATVLVGEDPASAVYIGSRATRTDSGAGSTRLPDGVTSISEYLRLRTVEEFGVNNEIRVIHNFVNCEMYTPDPQRSQAARYAPSADHRSTVRRRCARRDVAALRPAA